jgi:hypothetical protein
MTDFMERERAQVMVKVVSGAYRLDVMVMTTERGVALVGGQLFGTFFAFDPERVRVFGFDDHPELRALWDGRRWDLPQVLAFAQQEVG